MNGDGTGLPFGVNDGILGWVIVGVLGSIWALYFTSQRDLVSVCVCVLCGWLGVWVVPHRESYIGARMCGILLQCMPLRCSALLLASLRICEPATYKCHSLCKLHVGQHPQPAQRPGAATCSQVRVGHPASGKWVLGKPLVLLLVLAACPCCAPSCTHYEQRVHEGVQGGRQVPTPLGGNELLPMLGPPLQ